MFSALAVAARLQRETEVECCAMTLLRMLYQIMWEKIIDAKLQKLGKEADKQALN